MVTRLVGWLVLLTVSVGTAQTVAPARYLSEEVGAGAAVGNAWQLELTGLFRFRAGAPYEEAPLAR